MGDEEKRKVSDAEDIIGDNPRQSLDIRKKSDLDQGLKEDTVKGGGGGFSWYMRGSP